MHRSSRSVRLMRQLQHWRGVEQPAVHVDVAGPKCHEGDDMRSAFGRNHDPLLKVDDLYNRSPPSEAEWPLSPDPGRPVRRSEERLLLPGELQFVVKQE